MASAIPCVLAIDVEPDAHRPSGNEPKPWKGYEQTVSFLSRFREQARKATHREAHFCWVHRMDPQIEIAYGSLTSSVDRYPDLLTRLQRAGDDLGLHTHAWRWSQEEGGWLADHGDQEWVDHCLRVSFRAFRDLFQRPCTTFRFGDRFLSQAVVEHLERVGVLYDLTLEPAEPLQEAIHEHEPHTGLLPDYTSIPRHPYRCVRGRYDQPDPDRNEGLWFLPLTAGEWHPDAARGQRLIRRVVTQALSPFMRVPPYLQPPKTHEGTLRLWESPTIMQDAVNRYLHSEKCPLLVFAIRTDMVLNPYVRRCIRRNLEQLLIPRGEASVLFCTPEEALGLWLRNQSRHVSS